jgi:hypothetical protein
MMNNETILKQFKEKVSDKISLQSKGINRFIVKNPFIFEDGDNYVIVLKYDKDNKQWFISDEGHTFLHLSYFMDEKDFSKGTRETIIANSKKMFDVQERDGELFLPIQDNAFGDALYDFVQCLMKITDITYLERERVKSTFFEDFKASINKIVTKKKIHVQFDTAYSEKDKNKDYPIDCMIKTKKEPIFIFAINNDNKCKDAMISIMMLERWSIKFHAVGIFEDQTEISRKVLAKFSNICEKQISGLDNIEYFEKYLEAHS